MAMKIFVAGHRGLVGSALMRSLLKKSPNAEVVCANRSVLDLRVQSEVETYFSRHKPDVVYLAAAKVGGIVANSTQPGDFILDNLKIQTNVIESAMKHGTKRFVFFGSSCIYPRMAKQPISESELLTGQLENTNKAYAVAKISGYTLCESLKTQYGFNYVALMPTNLYGPNDNYSPEASHVIPGLIRKLHEAKLRGDATYSCWGTGSALREFLYSDDLADAAITLADMYEVSGLVNVGYGSDISIKDLVHKVAKVVGFKGEIQWDSTKPDGTPRKILDCARLRNLTPWTPKVSLDDGLPKAYADFSCRYAPSSI